MGHVLCQTSAETLFHALLQLQTLLLRLMLQPLYYVVVVHVIMLIILFVAPLPWLPLGKLACAASVFSFSFNAVVVAGNILDTTTLHVI